jgi:tetratricopeptide (TPR) repeat protein
MRRWIGFVALILVLGAWPGAVEGQTGSTPTPLAGPAADVNALLREGIALHDKGDFDAAIEKYRQALALDPENAVILYEMGSSQFRKRDLKAAQVTAEKVLTLRGAPRDAWVLAGNVYDDLGDPARAVASYQAGIERYPEFFLLYFNLGATYRRLRKLPLARACLENSVALEPRHASSHFYLGRNYMEEGYRVPAILALTRFLILEPKTQRSGNAIGYLDEIFKSGVKKDSPGHTTITMNMDLPKDEGDFSAADLMVSISQTVQDLDPASGHKPEGPPEMDRLATVLAAVAESGKDAGKGFAAEYYAPPVIELARHHLTTAYAALALQSLTLPAYEAWTTEHRGQMLDASKFLSSYRWSLKRPPMPPIVAPDPSPTPSPAPQKN